MLQLMSKSFCLCNFGCLVMRGFVVTQREGFGFRGPTTVTGSKKNPGYPILFSYFSSLLISFLHDCGQVINFR